MMIKPLLLALMLSFPAHAESLSEPVVQFFGANATGRASIVLELVPEGMSITFNNRIVPSETIINFHMTLGGTTVDSVVVMESASVPDKMYVTAPDGYWCDPCEVTVKEGESGTVILYREMGV